MKTLLLNLLAASALLFCAGCTAEQEKEADLYQQTQEEVTSARMSFHVNVAAFDAATATTRAVTDWTWADGAVVYLQYYNGSSVVRGHAVYTLSTQTWEAFWNGTLGSGGKCEVYFFEGASTSDKHSVTLSAQQSVYADKAGSYSLSGSEMTLEANLTPLTGRIRFAGKSGLSIQVEGLTCYTGYDADNNLLSTSSAAISTQVGSNGYTPYFYAVFTDETQRQLTIMNSEDGDEIQFYKSFGASVLRVGESGYITIPTENTNKGWAVKTPPNEQEFTVSGNGKTVTFKMIKVAAGTFQMGSTSGESNEKPVHSVTLTKNYYMGETEVTQALWYAVMGLSPTSSGSSWSSTYGLSDNKPAYYISYEDCEQFLAKLNQLTGTNFRFPTEAEWEYAAKGGSKSKGYTYAGSNTIGDVAWYSGNAVGSGYDPTYGTQEVKTKQPNELGLYDMSGNVWEWCYDWYGSYPSGAQTDPTGASSGSYRVYRGGCWGDIAGLCRTARRANLTPSYRSDGVGFRLAL